MAASAGQQAMAVMWQDWAASDWLKQAAAVGLWVQVATSLGTGLGAQAAAADMGNGWASGRRHLAEAGHGARAWAVGQAAQVASGSGQQIQVVEMGPTEQAVAHRARRHGPRAKAAAG